MSAKAVHLNLLMESERLSSSPVRLRVMLPVLALLACVGMIVWWTVLFGRLLVLDTSTASLESEIASKKASYERVTQQMQQALELEAEIEQLDFYRASRRPWGKMLTSLAEAIPPKVQLVKLEIPAPPPQDLSLPKGVKGPPLWGPTGSVEKVSLFLYGRTPKETPVISLMETLESETFTNSLVIVKDPRSPDQSPKVHSFRQDTAQRDGSRMLAFEIEYRGQDRRFER